MAVSNTNQQLRFREVTDHVICMSNALFQVILFAMYFR